MSDLRPVYAEKALSQVPRLLSLQDRNRFSATYGCFHRSYWLDKTSDFPDAVRQFSVHTLALIYKHAFPGSIYYGQAKIRDWAIAGLDFWSRIQHDDGSFDEFYPYERGWVGPTAFTTYTSVEAMMLLGEEVPDDVATRVRNAVRRAAYFIAAGESEEDHLANHHAMACLAVWKAAKLLDDPVLVSRFERLWAGFMRYHTQEGWFREYDGIDPGYLSASVSFIGKIYQDNADPRILEVAQQAIELCSFFAYPNGFYAGSAGSRNTLHFYPHGCEVFADKIPLAAAVAEKMLQGLSTGALVPPEIMSDRYVHYRVPEFLLAYLSYTKRPPSMPALPCQQPSFTRYFPQARIYAANSDHYYQLANLAKGGVIKLFDRQSGQLLLNDCGILGQLDNGQLVSTQWIDPKYRCQTDEQGWTVSGNLAAIPSGKVFNLPKHLLFRFTLAILGRIPAFSHFLKGSIRKALILGQRAVPVQFQRRYQVDGHIVSIIDELKLVGDRQFTAVSFGDEVHLRYVPQSRYFQSQELDVTGYTLSATHLDYLNREKNIQVIRTFDGQQLKSDVRLEDTDDTDSLAHRQQKAYWEDMESHKNRRSPTHPAVTAFAKPKLGFAAQYGVFAAGNQVLDVGCGNGFFTSHFPPEVDVVALDFSSVMLHLNPCEQLTQASALSLPFANDTFDTVVCSNLLHHLPDPQAAVYEMARVSRRFLVLSEPNRNNPGMLLFGLIKPEERWSLKYTPNYLQTLAQGAGLTIRRCQALGAIVPNKTPVAALALLKKLDGPQPFGAYSILIAEKRHEAIPNA